MSPHTDAGALLKLADDCALYAKVIEGIIVVENDYQPGDVERREPRETLLKAEAFLRQAASHGRAGGEPALRAALQEIDEIGRKITDLKNEHGIRMGNIAHAALLGAGTAAQAPIDSDKEATFGEDGYNPAYDDGITFAIVQLAELTGSKDWQMRDGSEDHDTDVRDTIMDVLKCAGLYDDETGNFAGDGPSVPSADGGPAA